MSFLANVKLFKAVKGGDHEAVAKCLDEGASLKARNFNGWTPLDVAASNGDREMAELLISKGADVNVGAALQIAALNGWKDVAELLIAQGANVNARTKDGNTPIYQAACEGHGDIVELLIANGADLNIRGSDVMGSTPLAIATDPEVIALLKKHGAISANRTTNPDDMLFEAAFRGSLDGAAASLSAGAKVNGKFGSPAPLDVALNQGHADVARLLIDAGAKVSPTQSDRLSWLQSRSKAPAESFNEQRSGDLVLRCSRCGGELKKLDMARGAPTVGRLPILYDGVRCLNCGKLECRVCKGSPADRPCSFCGKPVEPAFARH